MSKKKRYKKKKPGVVNPVAGLREASLEAGFYDGRFKQKVVPDKKKKISKQGEKNYKIPTE